MTHRDTTTWRPDSRNFVPRALARTYHKTHSRFLNMLVATCHVVVGGNSFRFGRRLLGFSAVWTAQAKIPTLTETETNESPRLLKVKASWASACSSVRWKRSCIRKLSAASFDLWDVAGWEEARPAATMTRRVRRTNCIWVDGCMIATQGNENDTEINCPSAVWRHIIFIMFLIWKLWKWKVHCACPLLRLAFRMFFHLGEKFIDLHAYTTQNQNVLSHINFPIYYRFFLLLLRLCVHYLAAISLLRRRRHGSSCVSCWLTCFLIYFLTIWNRMHST